ncbi:hypothetical protein [Nesterenkonia massiliensis]|uniref:hypothetical protein n=1 Tax=Nesterenkonia massiliensis TaxID=1232429 RepID=UPI00040A2595|nr:hypothetical protein [Nesterenkonia massiliensis]
MPPQSDDDARVEGVPEHAALSPVQRFIAEAVERRREKFNVWENPLDNKAILLQDARKRRRTTPKGLGNSHLLMHKERLIGGVTWVYGGATTLVSHQAQHAAQSLQVQRQYLKASEVPTVSGRSFHSSSYGAAEAHLNRMHGAVTVRPTATRVRGGTTMNVSSPEHFKAAWEKTSAACARLRSVDQLIELEEYRPGLALRLYVVGEDVVAGVVRVPLYVVGNGKSTIGTLVDEELKKRSACEYLRGTQPTIDDAFLAPRGLKRDTVPEAGRVQLLTYDTDRREGGLTVDVLNRVSPDLRSLAVDAMWAFPGLSATAVDILTPSLEKTEEAIVSSIDPNASLAEFLYPAYGEYRRVGLAVLDHMIHSPIRRR